MLDYTKLRESIPEPTAAQIEWRKDYDSGYQAGVTGQPLEDRSEQWVGAWKTGNARHRVNTGEAIGVVSGGTKCEACGSQNFGYRMGCRCDGDVSWGALVADKSPDRCAVFMPWDQLRAARDAGTPVIDIGSGEVFCLDETKDND